MPEPEPYSIPIDGRWSLEDFYEFPRTYEQVYFLLFALSPDHSEQEDDRISHAFAALPWQGGYSAVNFYNQLKNVLRKKDRPTVVSIRYGSPGWFEITVILGIAFSIERIVTSVAKSIRQINTTYSEIVRNMQERKLLRLEAKRRELDFDTAELELIERSLNTMARILGFSNVQQINSLTGHPYRSLKILLSMYRRVRKLAEFENRGKIDLRRERKE